MHSIITHVSHVRYNHYLIFSIDLFWWSCTFYITRTPVRYLHLVVVYVLHYTRTRALF